MEALATAMQLGPRHSFWDISGCRPQGWLVALIVVSSLLSSGCQRLLAPDSAFNATLAPPPEPPPTSAIPRAGSMVSMPKYVIEPPDILLIDAVKIVPKAPHFIEVFDVLGVRADNAPLDSPVNGAYTVDPEGKIDLGPAYGKVQVIDLTVDEAKITIEKHLNQFLDIPDTSVTLAASAGVQRVAGQHLVGPDGYVNLGTYGSVYVAGLTLSQAQSVIEAQLARYLDQPEIVIDVYAYNSKSYYIITEGGGFGDNVQQLPITGNDTVLSAISNVGGLSQISSTRIWISRPAPNGVGCEQILPVHWDDITRGALNATNYQLFPGDRLFISEDKYQALDAWVSRVTRPFERLFGFSLLGTQMVNRFNRLPDAQN